MTSPWMLPGYQHLLQLQQHIHAFWQDEDGFDPMNPAHPLGLSDSNYLAVAPVRTGAHVEYFGSLWDDPWIWTLQTLAEPTVAEMLSSLTFSGPDEGANGTREWEFTALLDSDVRFPQLRSLFIKPTAPADHNDSLIQRAGTNMEEGGEIARFAAKAPHLREITVPNAPDASFFATPLPHLSMLRIGGGSETQNFIENLAASDNLPVLANLDFSESTELRFAWKTTRNAQAVTPFESYATLLKSPVGKRLRVLRLRNTGLSLTELEALRDLQPKLQFMVIQDNRGGYVSHFQQDAFPWRHLVQGDSGTEEARYANK